MILGASELQLPAIKMAKKMGLQVIAVDMDKNAVGFKFADIGLEISTLEKEKILEFASALNVSGIMTLASDQPMNTVAYVGNRLNLKVISERVAICTTNKGVMRDTLKKNKIAIPDYKIIKDFEGFLKEIKKFNLPCIIKPTDSSGSRGVQLKCDLNSLDEAYFYSSNYSRNGEIIIEEFMQGREFSVESMSFDGTPKIIAITEKETTGAPHFVEMGHIIPANISKVEEQQIKEIVESTIKALEITDGPSHCEVMLTESGPKIVEIGARLGGDNITTHLVPLATGYNIVKATINYAIDKEDVEQVKYRKTAIIKYINIAKCGQIKKVTGLKNIEKSNKFVELKINKKKGDFHDILKSSSDRVGYFILNGENRESIILEAEELLSKVEIIID